MRLRLAIVLLSTATAIAEGADATPHLPDEKGYLDTAVPFLEQHCIACHGSKKQKGKFRIDEQLPNNFIDALAVEKWSEVVDVVNSHEMPPEDEPQPGPGDAARFADWITGELARAEISKRSMHVVIRRMNRAEYANTIRDLVGVEFDEERFPEDPPSGGFDNIGAALTLSPLHLELYYDAARAILDEALVEDADAPPVTKWRFDPEESTKGMDRTREKRGKHNVLLNSGKNRIEDGFTVMRTDGWDKRIGFRDFAVEHEGEYLIRFRAATKVPMRDAVVAGARTILERRIEEKKTKDPKEAKRRQERLEEDLDHFRDDRMYAYGPARIQIIRKLGGQPESVAELDIDARHPNAKTYEVRAAFSTQKAGISFIYAYSVPKVLENFWMQGHEAFARPEAFIDWIELEGPIHEQWPPESHTRLLPDFPERGKDERAYAKRVLGLFMARAWRRLVEEHEIDAKLPLFDEARSLKKSFVEAIKSPMTAVLASPHFLYLTEPGRNDGRVLNNYEIATRLSYFLWSTTPDHALFDLADFNTVTNRELLVKQADRLLADPKVGAFVENFAGQWLELRKVGSNPPAENLYPRYDRHLETSIVAESKAFFREILQHDLSVRNFIKSDFVTINERLARFYGIPGVGGDAFRKVAVPAGVRRGGIATQASVLSITSNGTRTSPVVRGTWMLKNLLGTDPGLPVANAGEIMPKVPGIDKATVRQRLEIHRTLPQCARCHNKIDPLGFALENYNAAGEWRDKEGHGYNGRIGRNDPDIDASGKLPDGTEFTGIGGLQKVMLARQDLFLECLAAKMYTYALGRELGYSDRKQIADAVSYMKKNGLTLRSLVHHIVTSKLFLNK